MSDARESWDRIQSLFEKAIQLAPENRPPFLDRACGEDGYLRAELDSLLASFQPGEQELEASPVQLPRCDRSPEETEIPESTRQRNTRA